MKKTKRGPFYETPCINVINIRKAVHATRCCEWRSRQCNRSL